MVCALLQTHTAQHTVQAVNGAEFQHTANISELSDKDLSGISILFTVCTWKWGYSHGCHTAKLSQKWKEVTLTGRNANVPTEGLLCAQGFS